MAVCAVSCSFDESGLDSRLDAVKERIEALQSRIDEANGQVESLGLLTSGNVVTSVEKNSDGSYVLTYLDSKNESKTMVIAAMDQMINVPVIGVRKEENGLYYWTVTTGGETTDITVDGKPVPAAGKTPVISVDAQGFWTVDGERILNENGVPVEAKDGNTAIFKSIATDADGNLSVTLGNGTSLTIPVQNSLNLSVSSALNLTISNLGQVLKIGYDVTGSKAEGAIVAIAEAKSVTASLDKTAKEVSVSFGSTFESGHLILMATDLDKVTVLRPIFFDKAKETKILINTAEDLMNFAKGVNAQDGTESMDVYLEKDIDMSSVSNWTPIGNGTFSGTAVSGAAFKGTFYGKNHTIKGLKMVVPADAPARTTCGLFGVISGATVKDVNIGEGSILTSSSATMTCGGAVADRGDVECRVAANVVDDVAAMVAAGTSPENSRGDVADHKRSVREILMDIIDTPVSPELKPADSEGNITQKTEDLVGPYELHDFFLYHIFRFGAKPSKVYFLARKAFEGVYDDATILKWLNTFIRRFFAQQFKRSCLPDCPKVGSVSLSPRGDWRMPSDAWRTIFQNDLPER